MICLQQRHAHKARLGNNPQSRAPMIKDPVHNGGREVLSWNHPASHGWERLTDLFLFYPQWLLDNPGTPCDAMISVYEARLLVRVPFSGNMHLGLLALLSTSCPLPCSEVPSPVGVAAYARRMHTQLPTLALQGDTSLGNRRNCDLWVCLLWSFSALSTESMPSASPGWHGDGDRERVKRKG